MSEPQRQQCNLKSHYYRICLLRDYAVCLAQVRLDYVIMTRSQEAWAYYCACAMMLKYDDHKPGLAPHPLRRRWDDDEKDAYEASSTLKRTRTDAEDDADGNESDECQVVAYVPGDPINCDETTDSETENADNEPDIQSECEMCEIRPPEPKPALTILDVLTDHDDLEAIVNAMTEIAIAARHEKSEKKTADEGRWPKLRRLGAKLDLTI